VYIFGEILLFIALKNKKWPPLNLITDYEWIDKKTKKFSIYRSTDILPLEIPRWIEIPYAHHSPRKYIYPNYIKLTKQ
jgi:hypothetical protein